MSNPEDWSAVAFNTSPHSDNQIHSDEMAQAYGFRGGLVPGVVVSSYLIHPAVAAWGLDWLARGSAEVVVHKPTYHGEPFDVVLAKISGESYAAVLSDASGEAKASADVALTEVLPQPPVMRGDTLYNKSELPPEASVETMRRLQQEGMSALEIRWDHTNAMASYLADREGLPTVHRSAGGGYANAAFMLALTNWVLASNVHMNPWIHMQTRSQNFAPVATGSVLRVECDVADLFNRRGHEFVDLNVNAFVQSTGQPVMTAVLRAIYKMRPVS